MAEVRQSSVRAARLVEYFVGDDEDRKDRAWRFRGHGRTSGKTKGKQGISGVITCVECVQCYRYKCYLRNGNGNGVSEGKCPSLS